MDGETQPRAKECLLDIMLRVEGASYDLLSDADLDALSDASVVWPEDIPPESLVELECQVDGCCTVCTVSTLAGKLALISQSHFPNKQPCIE